MRRDYRAGNWAQEEWAKEIGEELARVRKQQGMTQEVLASKLGVTKQRLSQMENGWRINIDTLVIWSRELGRKIWIQRW